MTAWYNDTDPYVAQWLRNLIDAGRIAPGVVDERSIEDVKPTELMGYTQCHFFAGVGVWSLALRRAGWPDNRPIWTGSCPCQPFSAAGKSAGFDDERHLWPAWQWLIEQCQPGDILGEQVASKAAEPWLDLVQADLEALGYAFGAVAFPSAGVGAPHIRDRAYWVGHAQHGRREAGQPEWNGADATMPPIIAGGLAHMQSERRERELLRTQPGVQKNGTAKNREFSGLADAAHYQQHRGGHTGASGRAEHTIGGATGGLGNTTGERRGEAGALGAGHSEWFTDAGATGRPGPTNGHWRAADWLYCRDEKWRPVEPGTLPLVDGAPSRVGRLRAYGNAINAEAAKEFIRAVMQSG